MEQNELGPSCEEDTDRKQADGSGHQKKSHDEEVLVNPMVVTSHFNDLMKEKHSQVYPVIWVFS